MNSREFGRRLRAQREDQGKTQEQVAAAAKCSRGMISQWESGTPKKIDAQTLLDVAKYLRTTAEYLLSGERAVSEEAARYAPVVQGIGEDWPWLTPEDRERLRLEVHAIAERNRKLFEQLSAEHNTLRGAVPHEES